MSKQNDQTDTIIKAAVGIATVLVIKNALDKLFGDKGEGEKEIEDLSPEENPFNLNFGGGIDTMLSSIGFFKELEDRYQLELNEHDIYYNTNGDTDSKMMNIALIAHTIYDAFSFWTGKDEAQVLTAFNMLQSQTQLWYVAGFFNAVWQTDLWNYLKHGYQLGWFGSGLRGGLSNDVMNTIVAQVLALPVDQDGL